MAIRRDSAAIQDVPSEVVFPVVGITPQSIERHGENVDEWQDARIDELRTELPSRSGDWARQLRTS